MATIKAIEARSVHQIQSGQVIVDLCSVAKELVENSLDAGATSIEIRFRNNGIDLIEVQDNGSGISPENYENVALKHYTSKLASYDDLLRLQTFGFRGEALSSLCALSDFHITTAQANQAPRATRLDFEQSGKLKQTQVVAGQKGTTASVERLFKKLPVRRRELEKNVKREYGKVLNLLHAYACVSTGVRFSVKNTVAKRSAVVFTTNGNQTTKDNIANVYGAKTLLALIPLDLELEFEPSAAGRRTADEVNRIQVRGHVSKPVVGEGRQTPDRQMFFVNSRPCALPQIAKAFNEVYKSFNVAQSPFVFADFHMDTNAYDVNVSPDKRTILLHDAGALIESLKQSLQQLFESADQTVPQSNVLGRLAVARQRSLPEVTRATATADTEEMMAGEDPEDSTLTSKDRIKSLRSNIESRDTRPETPPRRSIPGEQQPLPAQTSGAQLQEGPQACAAEDEKSDDELFVREDVPPRRRNESSGDSESEAQSNRQSSRAPEDFETPNAVQSAFDRMRPRRVPAEMATITIGDTTVTSMVGSGVPRKRNTVGDLTSRPTRKRRIHTPSRPGIFGQRMLDFAAPGTQLESIQDSEEDEDQEEGCMDEDSGGEDEEAEEEGEEEIEEEQSEAEEMEDVAPSSPSNKDSASRASVERENDAEALQQPAAEDMDDEEKKKHEEAEVQRLIRDAEKAAQANSLSRANKLHKGVGHRDATVHLMTTIDGSLSKIQSRAASLQDSLTSPAADISEDEPGLLQVAAEERLSLTVTKDDFARMRILGQFNLGFILATRSTESKDELFIIDQHASDEKYNFERLQSETVVQNQRLVHPKRLDLTAVEEEIVIENQVALEKNGFIVDVDDSGDEPIGRRCRLLSLPLSKEVVFDVRDLEELIVLLSETISANTKTDVPRPSKVRKMFAMRACRSSIMIGKTLTQKQMERVVRNMGTIDKPWNCPHGRPTMRHLFSLGHWDEWDEYGGQDDDSEPVDRLDIWREYLADVDEE
ncbi:hypothetical protein BJX63DRAFT_400300 [Aspergillus granulosus]|uniref:Uncharacterized protein n=1 Tax=Aspergillus granulosus TaxID=176169 RepID=A0ABR4H6L2_9EURO